MHTLRPGLLLASLLLAGCAGVPMQSARTSSTPRIQPMVAAPAPKAAAVPAPADSAPMAPQATHAMAVPKAPVAPRLQPRTVAAAAPARHPAHHRVATPPVHTAPKVAGTVALHGHVALTAIRGHVSADDLAQTLVYFVPKSGNVAPHPGNFTVFTHDRAFDPVAMAIPAGSTVTFVNMDEVRHNEFSVTPGSTFNLGYQAPDQKTAHVFAHAGLVLVGCLVHRAMQLDLLMVPTAFATQVARDGVFSLRNLPPGPGVLYVWNPRGRLTARAMTLPTSGPVEEQVTLVKPVLPAQLDVTTQP